MLHIKEWSMGYNIDFIAYSWFSLKKIVILHLIAIKF
ncbi:hypothetical protein ES703_35461 [subsurface metagenome]